MKTLAILFVVFSLTSLALSEDSRKTGLSEETEDTDMDVKIMASVLRANKPGSKAITRKPCPEGLERTRLRCRKRVPS